jgi:ribonuclease P protein component
MIGRNHRFHGRASIQRLYKSGKMVRFGALSLKYGDNPRRSDYRLAVVVSRKVSKSAVVRNRIRRRLYEHVRILSSSFAKPADLLLIVYDESVADKPAVEVRQDVENLLKKAKLLAAEPSGRAIVEPKK